MFKGNIYLLFMHTEPGKHQPVPLSWLDGCEAVDLGWWVLHTDTAKLAAKGSDSVRLTASRSTSTTNNKSIRKKHGCM